MYLAMSRVAFREEAILKLVYITGFSEEAEHASSLQKEMLGEVLSDSTKKNLEMRAAAEQGACKGKKELATLAKQLGYDAIHDTVHEMQRRSSSWPFLRRPAGSLFRQIITNLPASLHGCGLFILWQNFGKWFKLQKVRFCFIKDGLIHGLIPVWMLTMHLLVFVLSS